MKQILGLFQTSDKNVNCTAAEPADPAAAEWPSHLKELHRVATRALKDLRRTNLRRLSDRERAEHDDLLKLMTAMSDRKKTAAVYFAMAEASSRIAGRPLSNAELAEAADLCQAFEQERLTDEERQAIERLARKRHVGNGG
jgi:hypothetical protein